MEAVSKCCWGIRTLLWLSNLGQTGQPGPGWLNSDGNSQTWRNVNPGRLQMWEVHVSSLLFHRTNILIGKGHVKEKIFWGKKQSKKIKIKSLMLSCSHTLIYSSSYTVPSTEHPSACQSPAHFYLHTVTVEVGKKSYLHHIGEQLRQRN